VIDNIFSNSNPNRDLLREVIVKIKLKNIDIQERIIIEALLDSKAIVLISSEFARKQEFKLKKIKRSFYKIYLPL